MATVEQTVVCIEAARFHYESHARYYRLRVPDFDTLANATKQHWVEFAEENIRAVGPPRPTRIAEYQAGLASAGL